MSKVAKGLVMDLGKLLGTKPTIRLISAKIFSMLRSVSSSAVRIALSSTYRAWTVPPPWQLKAGNQDELLRVMPKWQDSLLQHAKF